MLTISLVVWLSVVGPVAGDDKLASPAETVRFVDVGGFPSPSVPLGPHDRVFLRRGKKVLVLEVTAASREDGQSDVTESAAYKWILIDQDQVKSGVTQSRIRYKVNVTNDARRQLTLAEGSEGTTGSPGVAVTIEGMELNWSWRAEASVFLYVPPGNSYARLPSRDGR